METKLNLTDLLNILDNTESEEAKDLLETINDLDKKRSNLKNRCRLDFKVYLRDMLLKDRCELCGTTENLILHHEKSFSKMIDETINEVGMENIDLFRQVMLTKQIMEKNITLCEECHKEIHKEREKEEQGEAKQLELYLKQHCGEVMLTLEDRKELIEKIHATDNRGRLLKSATALNTHLEEVGSKFRITTLSKITKTIKGKKKQFKTPWKIDKK